MDVFDSLFVTLIYYYYYYWFSVLIGIVGIVANIVIGYVIVKTKELHTTVNFYLLSLAVSDSFNALTEIFTLVFRLTSWETFYTISTEINSCNNFVVSNLTITALTVDRYIAVCHPLKARYLSKMSRTIKVIAAIWTLSLFYCSSNVIKDVIGGCEGPFCIVLKVWGSLQLYVVVFCLTPAVIIIALYVMIGLKIRNFGSTSNRNNMRNTSSTRKTTARSGMLLSAAVVVEFLVCSVPYQVVLFMTVNVNREVVRENLVLVILLVVTRIINLVSVVIDPIIFNYFSSNFRKAFSDLVIRRKPPANAANAAPSAPNNQIVQE